MKSEPINMKSSSYRNNLNTHGGRQWGWLLAVGFMFVILGMAAIALPVAATLAVELFIGWILVAAGIVQAIHAFRAGKRAGFGVQLLLALLYLAVGVMLLAYPVEGMLTLTLFLALFFMAEGVFKIILAFQLRPMAHWGWTFVGGILSLILGAIIWAGWPTTAAWAIGLIFGIDLIFSGWSLVMLALSLRSLPMYGRRMPCIGEECPSQ